MRKTTASLMVFVLLALLGSTPAARACGGFFCTNIPVDQSAERIIFAVNEAQGTIDAYVQINYTGSPDQFAWVVPVPNPPTLDVAEMELFDDLDMITRPNYIPPPFPEDCPIPMPASGGGPEGVMVLGQGSVGPYDYAIVGSENPREMVQWLRDNGYQITPAMEPLVDVYVREGMNFLAMKLQPDQEVKDIQPVKMTYRSSKPMIPLRLTAVAANPDMAVVTWILAQSQVEPENYAVMNIPDDQITFTLFGGNNYRTLVSDTANTLGGRAFITEFAGPTAQLTATDPALQALLRQYSYLTRVYTVISPEEMTVDPVFKFNPALPDISNQHDLSKDSRVWDCQTYSNRAVSPPQAALTRLGNRPILLTAVIVIGLVLLALIVFGIMLVRRRTN